MQVFNIVGARPNFMKVAPVHEAMLAAGIQARLIHTGQHYDANMSKIFFDQLGMPNPEHYLGVGSASHAVQTARIMEAFEPLVIEGHPDLVLVAGDVNSTIACALVAAKLHVPVAHLEAGLRSFDRTMPEELNRILTDQLSDLLLTPSADADANLVKEGIAPSKIRRVGNAMIDSLTKHLDVARKTSVLRDLGLEEQGYALTTLHRAENVDSRDMLDGLLGALADIGADIEVILPLHPRTRARIESFGFADRIGASTGIRVLEPIGYLEFLALQAAAKLVLTDSGGIQEETTALAVPCLTLRDNTERPITVDEGTNQLVGRDRGTIVAAAREILAGHGKSGRLPELWDGHAGERVAHEVQQLGLRA